MPPQTSQSNSIPPPPPGYTLDTIPPPPAGYTLDSPSFTNQQFHKEISKPTELPGASNELKKFAIGIPVGAAKSAAQIAANSPVGTLAAGLPSAPAGAVPGVKEIVQPKGAGEHVGAALEQTGEMALTGGPLRNLAVGALSKLPFLGRYMAPGARVAAEAVNTASNAAAHGQDPNASALVGGAGATAAEFLPFLRNILKESAEKQYGKVLSPTTRANKNITQRVVPELLNRNELAMTSGQLQSRAEENVEKFGQQINKAVANVPASVKPNPQNIIDHLENYKQDFMVNGVPVDTDAVNKANELQGIIKQLGPDVSYQSLNKVRQIWDSKVAKAGGFAGKTLAEGSMVDAQREAAGAIRQELSRQSPDISKINGEFHFWKGVSDVLGDTAERRVGQEGGLLAKVAASAFGAGGLVHGAVTGGATNAAVDAASWGTVMYLTTKAVQSPAWRTTSAVLKNQLADAIASGSAQKVTSVVTRITSSAASQGARPQMPSENSLPPFLRRLSVMQEGNSSPTR